MESVVVTKTKGCILTATSRPIDSLVDLSRDPVSGFFHRDAGIEVEGRLSLSLESLEKTPGWSLELIGSSTVRTKEVSRWPLLGLGPLDGRVRSLI
jgi:hypothetical protein